MLVKNHGFHSIGSLSESLGSPRSGTRYRFRGKDSGRLDGALIPVDLLANARSLGAHVIEVHSASELEQAIKDAKATRRTAARSSSTSRPIRSSWRRTTGLGGTCPSARCPRSTAPNTPTTSTWTQGDAASAARPLPAPQRTEG